MRIAERCVQDESPEGTTRKRTPELPSALLRRAPLTSPHCANRPRHSQLLSFEELCSMRNPKGRSWFFARCEISGHHRTTS